MTNKKAIEFIEDVLDSPCCYYDNTLEYKLTSYDKGWLRKAKEALEKQIPKRPYLDNDNGIYYKSYCPTCNRSLFPNDDHCLCGQAIDWNKNSDSI